MNEYEQLITVISMTMGIAWASGINLYAAILVLGLGGATGNIELPQSLQVVQDPLVISAAGIMYAIEFFADKTPGVDTGWDAIHTFIRIPAGAMLAAAAVGDVTPALQITAGILGGTLTGATHAAKAGTRVMINTSPEPFSNWGASILEDIAVILGLWAALTHPWLFVAMAIAFIALLVWLLPKLWRGIHKVFSKLREWLGFNVTDKGKVESETSKREKRLQQLLDDGAINQQVYDQLK